MAAMRSSRSRDPTGTPARQRRRLGIAPAAPRIRPRTTTIQTPVLCGWLVATGALATSLTAGLGFFAVAAFAAAARFRAAASSAGVRFGRGLTRKSAFGCVLAHWAYE